MQCQKLKTYMESGRVVFLPPKGIQSNPGQPRQVFEEAGLAELADYTMSKWYKIPKVLTSFIGRYANSRGEFNYTDADPLAGAADGSCPVLFLLGENNEYIPAEETLALYEAWGGEKELCSYPSRNGLIYAENTEDIQSRLDAWMDTYVK